MVPEQHVNLLPHTTFHIAAFARYFARVHSKEGLNGLLSAADAFGPMMVLGGGSNILMTKDFDGLVLKNEISGIDIIKEDDQHVYLRAGAGENWHGLVRFCVEHNYAGIENLSLIPGNVGASPMQNIGAYGVEIKDVFHELEAVHIADRTTRIFSKEECAFGYRESIFKGKFKNQFVITQVTLRLNRQPVFHTSYGAISQELERMGVKDLSIAAISQAVINIRTSKLPDPDEIGNAGSFFKNPLVGNEQFEELKKNFPAIVGFPAGTAHTKLAAGWLIEQCGWKGYRKGDAGCYQKQALVLVNYGKATGQEIFELSEEIILSVKKQFGVVLEREVNII
jgi:UDP-N-acetylmuramate dehydrogenase